MLFKVLGFVFYMKKYLLKVSDEKGGVVSSTRTTSSKRFLSRLSRVRDQTGHFKIDIKVRYGWFIDNFGKRVEFNNQGKYNNYSDALLAFRAFDELDENDFR